MAPQARPAARHRCLYRIRAARLRSFPRFAARLSCAFCHRIRLRTFHYCGQTSLQASVIPKRRASALSLINFFWSFGAMLAPLLVRLADAPLSAQTLVVVACCTLCGLRSVVFCSRCGAAFMMLALRRYLQTTSSSRSGLPVATFVFFMGMLFLYGGLETSLSGWLTTYAFRYGDRTLVISQYTTLLLVDESHRRPRGLCRSPAKSCGRRCSGEPP